MQALLAQTQCYVSLLRKSLGPDVLVTPDSRYLLDISSTRSWSAAGTPISCRSWKP
jgi:hypothetical protein